MTNEELVYLHRRGDKQALERLLEQNTGIVNKLVNKFYVKGTNSIDREDLFQEGMIGLITAANKYDFDNPKKAKFITYAVFWINAKINRFVSDRSTNEETSLNTPVGEYGDSELMDYIEGVDYSFENVEDKILNEQLRKELEDVMTNYNTLEEREVLKFRNGWDNNQCMTLNEIGEIFSVTAERIRQLESRAMRKIRKSPWGAKKQMEIYKEKYMNRKNTIDGFLSMEDFKRKYFLAL